MKKQNFIKSSAVLMVSVMISKIAGALFRIPLAGMLGGTGMAYFSGAYGIFLPVYAVFVSGFSTAAAGLTAEKTVLYGSEGADKVRRCSLLLFSAAGAVGTAVMILFAAPFSVYAAGNDRITLSLMIIAPSVLFSCISAAYRGCAEGHSDMFPTAVSQITESIVKLVTGLMICRTVINNADWFEGRFSCICTDIPALASAGACAGVMLSVFAGMIYMIADSVFRKKKYCAEGAARCSETSMDIVKSLVKTAVPVAAASLLSSLASLIDLCTIIRYTERSVTENYEFYKERYSYVFSAGTDRNQFAVFAYGAFSGMAVTVFNLVPSFTNMFGKSIFPSVAGAWTRGDTQTIGKNAEKVLKVTAAAAMPAGFGIFVLADEILAFLFPSSAAENMFCADALRYLGISVIFLCITFPVFSMLQATGKAFAAAVIMAGGAAVKLAGNLILVRIPELNVSGAAISTGICYIFILAVSLRKLVRHTGIRPDYFKLFSGPLYSSLLCAAAAWTVKTLPFMPDSNIVILFSSAAAGAVIYIISMYILGEYKIFLHTDECGNV